MGCLFRIFPNHLISFFVPISRIFSTFPLHFRKDFGGGFLFLAVFRITEPDALPEIHSVATAENIANRILPALAYLLVPALIVINARRSVRIKVKGKPYYPYTPAGLPALMQTFWLDIPGLNVVNLAEMISCVL